MEERDRYNMGGIPASSATTIRPDVVEPPSPEDGTNLKRSLQIDMKGLMGDAVGNVRACSHFPLLFALKDDSYP